MAEIYLCDVSVLAGRRAAIIGTDIIFIVGSLLIASASSLALILVGQ
eukprot:COSAG01_NODE_26410_length_715_cov_0.775974_1_plen_47_part_00